MSNFRIGKQDYLPSSTRLPFGGEVCFTGVTRDTDPNQSITSIILTVKPSKYYTVENNNFFAADNTFIYANVITGATLGNATSYIVFFDVVFTKPFNYEPTVTSTITLNPTGTAQAIANQIISFDLTVSTTRATIGYAIVVFGESALESNNLVATVFSTVPNKSCVNFVVTPDN